MTTGPIGSEDIRTFDCRDLFPGNMVSHQVSVTDIMKEDDWENRTQREEVMVRPKD